MTTVHRLQKIGLQNGVCTAPPHFQAKEYTRDLKSRRLEFYELVGRQGAFLGLVSIDGQTREAVEARGPGNELLRKYAPSLIKLLNHTGAKVGDCSDLVEVGLADGFLTIDRIRRDAKCQNVRLWRSKGGRILGEYEENWFLLARESNHGRQFVSGTGQYDAEALLWTMFGAPFPGRCAPPPARKGKIRRDGSIANDQEIAPHVQP